MAPEGRMEPPYELPPEVQQVWDFTVEQLQRMGVDSPADVNQLVVYCVNVVLFHEAYTWLTKTGMLMRSNSDRFQISKHLLIMERASREIIRYGAEFGLTPASRTRIDMLHPLMGGPRSTGPNPFAQAPSPRASNPFAG